VDRSFGFRHVLILLLILSLILAPRPLAGSLALAAARRASAAGDPTAAAEAFAYAARRLPWEARLYGWTGQAFLQAGSPQAAVQWFARGEARQALTHTDWLVYADALVTLGDDPAAARAWEQSMLLFGPSFQASRGLALLSRRAGDLPGAIAHLQQALLLSPGEAEAHYQLGLLWTATAPENAPLELLLALDMDESRQAAVEWLRAEIRYALSVDDRAFQFTVCGRALAALGEWDLAAEAFSRGIQADETYAEAWAWLGEARQQRSLDGRTQLDQALALDAGSASVQALDGMYWLRQGDFERALAAFSLAAAFEPGNPAWQVALGDAAAAGGDLLAASIHYLHAVELGPEDAAAWRALALFSLDNDTDVENSAFAAARHLLLLAPDDWLTHDIVGRTATILRFRVEAEEQLLRAIEIAPLEPAPHLHLALTYLEFGEEALAYDKLVDTLALDPGGQYGWLAQRILETYFP
jgi:tetratricopeptide (TPR) repeat protein